MQLGIITPSDDTQLSGTSFAGYIARAQPFYRGLSIWKHGTSFGFMLSTEFPTPLPTSLDDVKYPLLDELINYWFLVEF